MSVLKQLSNQTTATINTSILNGIRGLAALYVLVGHARWLLWEGYSGGYLEHPETYNWFTKILVYIFSIFGKGHVAVILFFVLSGFVIHYSSIRQHKNKIDLPDYFKRRFLRIYPPLIFCMLLTLILDFTGKYVFGYSIYFQRTPVLLINSNITTDLNWVTAIGNLMMVQNVYTHVWGTNGPLWSLMYEWWFYMLYPVIYYLYKKNKYFSYAIVWLLFILASNGLFDNKLASSVFNYLLCWSLGALLADVLLGKIRVFWYIIPLVICVTEFTINGPDSNSVYQLAIVDTLIGFIFTALLFALLKFKTLFSLHRVFDSFNLLGDYSYTLYVIHVPILVMINGIVLSFTGNRMPQNFYIMFISIAFILAFAYLLHFLTEIPFRRKIVAKVIK